MPSVTIPDTAHEALRAFVKLDESRFDQLIEKLSEADAELIDTQFSTRIADQFPPEDRPTIKAIVDEFFQFDGVREEFGGSASAAQKELVDAAGEFDFLTASERQVFSSRLEKVFGATKSLSLTRKAAGVISDHQRVFYSARIMTDLRPIFDESAQEVEAFAIVHNLIIHFGETSSTHEDFHVTLDSRDLEELQSALNRATSKAAALKSIVEKTHIRFLSPGE